MRGFFNELQIYGAKGEHKFEERINPERLREAKEAKGLFKTKIRKLFSGFFFRLIVFLLTFSLIFSPTASYAQSINLLNLPIPGTMVTPTPAFMPVLLKGMTIHPEDPLKFDFIIDSGNTNFSTDQVKQESEKLVKYFLASMTVPKDDLWVNLSPNEPDRIIPDYLGKTELGRDMLAQDYILKQLTASLMYPEKELGKKFWDRIYKRAKEEFGTSEIPVNTFNKVWILPETATVYEHEQTVYIVDAHLKVMLDADYVAMEAQQADTDTSRDPSRGQAMQNANVGAPGRSPLQDDSSESSEQIIREIILPEIEREVNEGAHFAPLRQIYHSLILAKWYKETIKDSLLSQVYVDKNLTDGVSVDDETIKDQIYTQYMEAYKKGVFNYIKEDYDKLSQEYIPRKYFSGGELLTDVPLEIIPKSSSPIIRDSDNPKYQAEVKVSPQSDYAVSSPVSLELKTIVAEILSLSDNDLSRDQVSGFLNDMKTLAEQLEELIKKRKTRLKYLSHVDADGIGSAAILMSILSKRGFTVNNRHAARINENILSKLMPKGDDFDAVVISDFGSGSISLIRDFMARQGINVPLFVIDHHDIDKSYFDSLDGVTVVNGLKQGILPEKYASASITSFMFAYIWNKLNPFISKENMRQLAFYGLVGEFGDKSNVQDKSLYGFGKFASEQAQNVSFNGKDYDLTLPNGYSTIPMFELADLITTIGFLDPRLGVNILLNSEKIDEYINKAQEISTSLKSRYETTRRILRKEVKPADNDIFVIKKHIEFYFSNELFRSIESDLSKTGEFKLESKVVGVAANYVKDAKDHDPSRVVMVGMFDEKLRAMKISVRTPKEIEEKIAKGEYPTVADFIEHGYKHQDSCHEYRGAFVYENVDELDGILKGINDYIEEFIQTGGSKGLIKQSSSPVEEREGKHEEKFRRMVSLNEGGVQQMLSGYVQQRNRYFPERHLSVSVFRNPYYDEISPEDIFGEYDPSEEPLVEEVEVLIKKLVKEHQLKLETGIDPHVFSVAQIAEELYEQRYQKPAPVYLKLAALLHDIDRAYPRRSIYKEDYEAVIPSHSQFYDLYKRAHSVQAAQIASEILKELGANPKLIRKVVRVIMNHEFGGREDTVIVKEADSISFFKDNVGFHSKQGEKKSKAHMALSYFLVSDQSRQMINKLMQEQYGNREDGKLILQWFEEMKKDEQLKRQYEQENKESSKILPVHVAFVDTQTQRPFILALPLSPLDDLSNVLNVIGSLIHREGFEGTFNNQKIVALISDFLKTRAQEAKQDTKDEARATSDEGDFSSSPVVEDTQFKVPLGKIKISWGEDDFTVNEETIPYEEINYDSVIDIKADKAVDPVYDRLMAQIKNKHSELGLWHLVGKLSMESGNKVMYWENATFKVVLREILRNARLHGNKSDVEIEAGLDHEGRYVLTVRDFGKGLSGVDKERMFHQHFTTRENVMEPGRVGMGLYLSRKFVRRVIGEGADIYAYDNRMDLGLDHDGATFKVVIPFEKSKTWSSSPVFDRDALSVKREAYQEKRDTRDEEGPSSSPVGGIDEKWDGVPKEEVLRYDISKLSRVSESTAYREWLIGYLENKFGKAIDIISIGAGRGVLEKELIDRGHNVLAVELKPDYVRTIRDKGIEAIQEDGRGFAHLLDDSKRFDLAIFSESLGSIGLNSVDETKKVLKEDGHILIAEYPFMNEMDSRKIREMFPVNRLQPEEIESALKRFGYSGIDQELTEFFRDDDGRWYAPMVVFTASSPVLGDKWEHFSIQQANELRKKYLGLLKDDSFDADAEVGRLIEDYSYKVTMSLSDAQNEFVFGRLRKELEALKKQDPKKYKETVLAAKFLHDEFEISKLLEYNFLSRNNPLFDDKVFEYFLLKGTRLDYDDTMRVRDAIKDEYVFDAQLRIVSEHHQVLVGPEDHMEPFEYRMLLKNDTQLVSLYLEELASNKRNVGYGSVRRLLAAASFAVDQNLEVAFDFLNGIIPILKASKIITQDTDFVQVLISHLLNSRNFIKYYYQIRKLVEVVPAQIRAGKENELRTILAEIDDVRGRGHDLFRYLRVIYHKNPNSGFLDLIKHLFVSIDQGKTLGYLKSIMDPEGQNLFLNDEQIQKSSRWEAQIKDILSAGQRISGIHNVYDLLDLNEKQFQEILDDLSGMSAQDQEDWRYLFEIWIVTQRTYSYGIAADVELQNPDQVLIDNLEKRSGLLRDLQQVKANLDIHADYYDRRHMGEFTAGYEGYLGVDAEYDEGKYNQFVQLRMLNAEARSALEQLLKGLKQNIQDNQDPEDNFTRSKSVLYQSIRHLAFNGLATENLMRIAAALDSHLSSDQYRDVLKLIENEVNAIVDYINLTFRYGSALVGKNISLEKYQSQYSREFDQSLDSQEKERVAQEKLIGDIFAEERSYQLVQQALVLFREALGQYQKRVSESTEKQVLFEDIELKPLLLSSEETIFPHERGAKASQLQQVGKMGIKIPQAVSLPSLNRTVSIKRLKELEVAIVDSLIKLEQQTGKQFPFSGMPLDPKKEILLTSVRSGSFRSMPGMLTSILNTVLNDPIVDFMIKQKKENERFILDNYRRFLASYAEHVLFIRRDLLIQIIDEMKKEKGSLEIPISQFSVEEMRDLVERYKGLIFNVQNIMADVISQLSENASREDIETLLDDHRNYLDIEKFFDGADERFWIDRIYQDSIIEKTDNGYSFTLDPLDVMINSVLAVYYSWDFPDVGVFREANGISYRWGTGVLITEMIFGNYNENSATAVLFTDDPQTGSHRITGDYKMRSQGEEIVGGRTIHAIPIEDMESISPEMFEKMGEVANLAKTLFRKPQEMEITVEDGVLYTLQSRSLSMVKAETRVAAVDQKPVVKGEGQSANALWARLVIHESDIVETKEKIQKLREEMRSKGEEDIGIVIVSYYFTPDEIALFFDENVKGALCAIKGGSAHALLFARDAGKVLVSNLSGYHKEGKKVYIGGKELKPGINGAIYTIDGNSTELSTKGGHIYEGKLPIEKIGDRDSSSSPVSDSDQRSVVSGQKDTSAGTRVTSDEIGGIDLNEIDVDRQGAGVDIQFDPIQVQEFIDTGLTGFAPVIINIVPLPSVLPLLGLAPRKEDEEFEISKR